MINTLIFDFGDVFLTLEDPQEVLFIDDTEENTQAAEQLGFHTWNLHPEEEKVTELFNRKSHFF